MFVDPPRVEQILDPEFRASLLEAVEGDEWEPRDFDYWVKRFCEALEEAQNHGL